MTSGLLADASGVCPVCGADPHGRCVNQTTNQPMRYGVHWQRLKSDPDVDSDPLASTETAERGGGKPFTLTRPQNGLEGK